MVFAAVHRQAARRTSLLSANAFSRHVFAFSTSARRGYAGEASTVTRDPMTGELTGLPDIEVRKAYQSLYQVFSFLISCSSRAAKATTVHQE